MRRYVSGLFVVTVDEQYYAVNLTQEGQAILVRTWAKGRSGVRQVFPLEHPNIHQIFPPRHQTNPGPAVAAAIRAAQAKQVERRQEADRPPLDDDSDIPF
jgi:hypothetical protein